MFDHQTLIKRELLSFPSSPVSEPELLVRSNSKLPTSTTEMSETETESEIFNDPNQLELLKVESNFSSDIGYESLNSPFSLSDNDSDLDEFNDKLNDLFPFV